jgi:hypothetical protein
MPLSVDERIKRDFAAYLGVAMGPGEVIIGARDDGTPVKKQFDLVSADGATVASVRSSCLHLKSRPGQKAYGSLYRVLGALLYLHLCHSCQDRYLIIADRAMFDEIYGEYSGIFTDIKIVHWDDIRKR